LRHGDPDGHLDVVTAPDPDGRPELDRLPVLDVVALLLDAEARVLPAVSRARQEIALGAEAMVRAWTSGGRWIFVGAGTSGRIGWAEAAEIPGTFGLARNRILARVAGGLDCSDADEDDAAAAAGDLADLDPHADDVAIAVAASGATPYTVELAAQAAARGATVIAVVTVPGSPLAELADIAIETTVGEELVRGSTRLGAGTAQKLVLNALTTAAAVRLGRVHGDLMIDVEPANEKLRQRSAGIVAEIAGCDLVAARAALDRCQGNARAAVLVLLRSLEPSAAIALSRTHTGLRAALDIS
jgi:N-acetylmuramic acid 6-phosphate etherase